MVPGWVKLTRGDNSEVFVNLAHAVTFTPLTVISNGVVGRRTIIRFIDGKAAPVEVQEAPSEILKTWPHQIPWRIARRLKRGIARLLGLHRHRDRERTVAQDGPSSGGSV